MSINYNTHIKLDPIGGSRQQHNTGASKQTTYRPDPLIYHDKNEEGAINDAIKIGYLIYPSKEILWKVFENQPNFSEFQQYVAKKAALTAAKTPRNNKTNDELYQDLYAIKHLNLTGLHILEIGDVCFCERLQILNLSNNYLLRIEPLIQCTNLIRLDLHNNQISVLPDMKFWGRLKNLRVLYLHNNPLGKLDNLRRMAACSSLEILTLYDTPLSLKKNYRHHVVNIVFTLKALDDYIVSDEEIIEDANFNNKFSSKSSHLHCNLYIAPSKTNDYYHEMRLTNELLKRVNSIIAKYSPVHIIQKYIRGHLERKLVKQHKEAQLWATLKIQKWWRKLKKLEYKPPKVRSEHQRRSNLGRYQNPLLVNKNGGDQVQSASFTTAQSQEEYFNGRRHPLNTPLSRNTNLIIDLNKLQNRSSSMMEVLNNEAAAQAMMDSTYNFYAHVASHGGHHERSRSEFDVYTMFAQQSKGTPTLGLVPELDSSRKKKQPRKLDMDKFFELGQLLNKFSVDFDGQVVEGKEHAEDDDDEEVERDADKAYRLPLQAKKTEFKSQNNYLADLINEKKFYRQVIQEMEIEAHKKMFEQRENVEVINRKPIKTNDQRFFQKIYGTMTLGCLRAVDKAYLDRNMAERRQNRSQMVQKYKENKEFTHQQVNYFREERLREVQKGRERDKLQFTVARRRLELEKMQDREQVQETKGKNKEFNTDRRKDILVAVDFNKQHLSVSKALQKHEFNLNRETHQKKNALVVEKQRVVTYEQQEIVKKYLQQRNLLRVSQTQADREKIDSKVLQDANDRLLSSKKRVAKLKATNTALSKFYAFHSGTKTSDRTVSSFAIPSEILHNIGKTPQTETMRVTVLDTTALERGLYSEKTTTNKFRTPLTNNNE